MAVSSGAAFRCELGGPDTIVRFGRQCVATYDVLFQITTSVASGTA